MKIIPPHMSFEQAVRSGMTGRIEFEPFLGWLRTLPCDTCGRPAPSEASHVNGFKGMGTKGPDPFSIPECHDCNMNYDRNPPEVDSRIRRAAFYMLRAIYEGSLVWRRKPLDTVAVPPLPPSLAGVWTPARVVNLAEAKQIDGLCALLNAMQPGLR